LVISDISSILCLLAVAKNIFKSHEEHGGWFQAVKGNIKFYIEIVKESFKELYKIGKELFKTPNLKYFLSSFFFYSVGMQTIFLMATLFGKSEINLEEGKLPLVGEIFSRKPQIRN